MRLLKGLINKEKYLKMTDISNLNIKNNPVNMYRSAIIVVKQVKNMEILIPGDYSKRDVEIYKRAWEDCCDMINGELIVLGVEEK